MGKTVIARSDGPGFLVNRCNRPFGLEALRLLQERIADVETIDRICRHRGRLPDGPVRADGPGRRRHRLRGLQELLRAELRRAALAALADHRALRRRRACTAARAGAATTTTRSDPYRAPIPDPRPRQPTPAAPAPPRASAARRSPRPAVRMPSSGSPLPGDQRVRLRARRRRRPARRTSTPA